MPQIDMSDQEWGQVMNILATTKEWPWTVTNPLLMKIGEQLRRDVRVRNYSQDTPRQKSDGEDMEARQ